MPLGKKNEKNMYRTGEIWLKSSTGEKDLGVPVDHMCKMSQECTRISGREPPSHHPALCPEPPPMLFVCLFLLTAGMIQLSLVYHVQPVTHTPILSKKTWSLK